VRRHFIVLPGWQILACLFQYIVWFLWHIKMDGVYGVQAERRFWVWVGYLSKYFCRERNLVHVCVLRERAMDGCVWAMGFGVAISGFTYGLDVSRWILLGRRKK
jgi:hypothetical protein